VDLRTGKIVYTKELDASEKLGGASASARSIAVGLDNYLDNNIDELL
jgi:hypothetical protein